MDRNRVARGEVFVRRGTNHHYVVLAAGPRGVKLQGRPESDDIALIRWPQFEHFFEPVAVWYRRQAIERKGDAIA